MEWVQKTTITDRNGEIFWYDCGEEAAWRDLGTRIVTKNISVT
jgi:hypothetical protein